MKRPKTVRRSHLPAAVIPFAPFEPTLAGFRMKRREIPFQLFFHGKEHPVRYLTFLSHDPNR